MMRSKLIDFLCSSALGKDIDIKIHVDGKLRGIQDVIYYPPSEMTKTTPTSGTITYTQPAYLELIWNGDE